MYKCKRDNFLFFLFLFSTCLFQTMRKELTCRWEKEVKGRKNRVRNEHLFPANSAEKREEERSSYARRILWNFSFYFASDMGISHTHVKTKRDRLRDARAYEECVRSRWERKTRVDNARAVRSYAKVESHFLGGEEKRPYNVCTWVCALVCARACVSIGPDGTVGYFSIFDITRISSIFSFLFPNLIVIVWLFKIHGIRKRSNGSRWLFYYNLSFC